MEDTTTRVGERLAALRKLRGMTQAQLAQAAHFSTSLVKQVEQGTTPPSAALVAGAARVLGVRPAHLYGLEDQSMAEESTKMQLAELRAAVDAWDDPRPEGDPLALDAIDRRLDKTARKVTGTKYADAATDLAVLLHHLYPLTDRAGTAGEAARAALHDAYRLTATVAGRYRQADLAAIASERHIQLAPRTGDPLRVAISAFHRSSRYLSIGDYSGGLRMLGRVADHVAAPSAVATQLHLRNAVLEARAGRLDRADEFLAEARRAPTDDAGYRGIDASELNVDVHWCALPVEAMDGAEAVRRGGQLRLVDTRRPERLGHHHIDQARARFLHGDREGCLTELNAARKVSPFATRHHPHVRETVFALAAADRRATDSLAGFAQWAGIAV